MNPYIIGIVGPCAAGKTTLVSRLKEHSYAGKHIAQEHSYVADMWKRLSDPHVLIYLDVSYPLSLERRKMNWSEKEYHEQLHRLRNARENADLYINTDILTTDEVFNMVLDFLESRDQLGFNNIGQSS